MAIARQDLQYTRRKWVNRVMLGLCGSAAAFAAAILLIVLLYTAGKGIAYLNVDFVTQTAAPLGEEGGGMRNEIIGTIILVGLATIMGLPVGLMGGIFLAEFGNGPVGSAIRAGTDILAGVPSVVIGIFAYVVAVKPFGTFSAWSAGFALAIIMLPVVARTTEEMLRLVPSTYREAALALGIPYWRTIISVVIPGALAGIVTGTLLAVARIAGETAPLIFTALGNRFGFSGLTRPIAALPLQIWRYALSAYDTWHQQAWAASFLLIMLVLLAGILARWFTARITRRVR